MAQQNVFLGLPLQLLDEEVVLLLENGQSSSPSCVPWSRSSLPPCILTRTQQSDTYFISFVSRFKGAAVIVDDEGSHARYAHHHQLVEWDESRLASIRSQQKSVSFLNIADTFTGTTKFTQGKGKSKSKPTGPDSSEAALKKRMEREAKKASLAAAALAQAQAQVDGEDPPSGSDSRPDISRLLASDQSPSVPYSSIREAPNVNKTVKAAAPSLDPSVINPSSFAPLPVHTITIPATSSAFPWLSDITSSSSPNFDSDFPPFTPPTSSDFTHTTLPSAREQGIWDFPLTLEQRARCAVFRSLHERGFWMGGGLRFGGDWLVYPGE